MKLLRLLGLRLLLPGSLRLLRGKWKTPALPTAIIQPADQIHGRRPRESYKSLNDVTIKRSFTFLQAN